MLSRVADSLFWLAMYLERAEHTARLLEVNLAMMLDEGEENSERRWLRVLNALAYVPSLMWKGDAYELANRLSFDIDNRSSIYHCITSARENARAVREQISTEQWQRLNQLFHAATLMERRTHSDLQQSDFLQSIIEGVHLFQGVTDSTMSHGTGWQFIQLGRHLERASATARLLNVYYKEMWSGSDGNRSLFTTDTVAESNQYLECIGLLRSCTAYEAWFRVYTAEITPERVLEFLLLDGDFPHSIRYSVDAVDSAVRAIGGESGLRVAAPLLRVSGSLRSSIEFSQIEDVLRVDLSAYLESILEKCRAIHDLVYEVYIQYSVQTALAN